MVLAEPLFPLTQLPDLLQDSGLLGFGDVELVRRDPRPIFGLLFREFSRRCLRARLFGLHVLEHGVLICDETLLGASASIFTQSWGMIHPIQG